MSANAATVFSIQSVNAGVGSNGASFDVLFTNTGPGSLTIEAFSFGVTTSDTNITFTSATTATTAATYIFSGSSLFGPNITLGTGAAPPSLQAADNFNVANSGVVVASGATFALGHVFFNVSNTATIGEIANVTFQVFPTTSLTNSAGGNVTINTLTPGTITIGAVPEPSSLALLLLALPLLWVRRRANR